MAKAIGFIESDFKYLWGFEDSLTGTTAVELAGRILIGILTQFTEQEFKKAGSVKVFPMLLEACQYLKKPVLI